MAGEVVVKQGDFGVDHVEEEELAGETGLFEGGESEFSEPREVGFREQVAGGKRDEVLVEDGVDAVLDTDAIMGEVGAFGAPAAEFGGGFVGGPDGGEEAGAEELGEDEGVDLVGFDLGFGDGVGGDGVGDVDGVNEGLEEADEGPGVRGGFDGDLMLLG